VRCAAAGYLTAGCAISHNVDWDFGISHRRLRAVREPSPHAFPPSVYTARDFAGSMVRSSDKRASRYDSFRADNLTPRLRRKSAFHPACDPGSTRPNRKLRESGELTKCVRFGSL
jgi:hypothetical protein